MTKLHSASSDTRSENVIKFNKHPIKIQFNSPHRGPTVYVLPIGDQEWWLRNMDINLNSNQ